MECFLITEFITGLQKVKTRMLFLDVLKASIDFLIEMKHNDSIAEK